MPVVRAAFCVALLACALAACSSGAIPVEDRSVSSKRYGQGQQRQVQVDHSAERHRVRKDDTLYAIAFRYGTDVRTLIRLNHLNRPYVIYPGQTLALRGPKSAAAGSSKRTAPPRSKTASPGKPPMQLAKGPWRWPTQGQVIGRYSGKGGNQGLDIGGAPGAAVRSTRDGVVVYSGNRVAGYGNLLIVKHSEEYLSAYAYNQRMLVSEGDKVKAGQKIALLGKSPFTKKPTLHFEIRRAGKPLNPQKLLPKRS